MACCGRPNRSDVHLSNEEEAEIESKTREYFDGVTPKRHTKPQRSEYTSSQYVDSLSNPNEDSEIPELVEFQRLENDTECNPATNDWIPDAADSAPTSSGKPGKSEN
ncbi:unnamed protein product [Prunus armeniaca]|uniref:Uncharacterized protein n=1 Tax=Prunus armeniaca TaxID=36596 RepID=A0A6J5XIB0_PRUAR|nr:unnamed protein product [Prunus armeniaca]